MQQQAPYLIGVPGQPWTTEHKQQWFAQQQVKRSYQQQVISALSDVCESLSVSEYGALSCDPERYPLFAIQSKNWRQGLPCVLVTGGVHGYETSGVQGAIRFAQDRAQEYAQQVNFLITPCISPWGYETINRWGPDAIDPNRSFSQNSPADAAAQVMKKVASVGDNWLMHIDLHETTDSDNAEFRPALAARDGVTHDNWNIPDGFYLVDDSNNPQPGFQQAIIRAVERVTHIAPADENGQIIGAPLEQKGVINYDKKALSLCGGMTNARFVSTTEVYPDSPSADDENCILAQVEAICSGLDFALKAGV